MTFDEIRLRLRDLTKMLSNPAVTLATIDAEFVTVMTLPVDDPGIGDYRQKQVLALQNARSVWGPLHT